MAVAAGECRRRHSVPLGVVGGTTSPEIPYAEVAGAENRFYRPSATPAPGSPPLHPLVALVAQEHQEDERDDARRVKQGLRHQRQGSPGHGAGLLLRLKTATR